MDVPSTEGEQADSPESMLDAVRDHREWDEDQREGQLARLVEKFPVDRLRETVRSRLIQLGGADGETILRVVEAYATPDLLRALAIALETQPDLPPERVWEALALLEANDVLNDFPLLAERWEDLNESLDDDDALGMLVHQLEEEPEGSWVALQGLGSVEPEVRASIIEGLADYPTGPGVVAFLRILTFSHEPSMRQSACRTLVARDDAEHRTAWAEIAHDHPDPEIRDRARRLLGTDAYAAIDRALNRPDRARPELVGSLVTALDGNGRGSIVLASRDRGRWIVASFTCDIWKGIINVLGLVSDDPTGASEVFQEFTTNRDRDFVEDTPQLATGLLAASLMLCGSETNPALRYWIERTAGPEFRSRPFASLYEDDTLVEQSLAKMTEASSEILKACPEWVDGSSLTFDIAEEIALRSIDAEPDPRRDAGAYRYLFEHRLVDRIEHYRRMLLWMAAFWFGAGDPQLARKAQALARQLSDPQHAVPSHPFAIELSTRSLREAQENLGSGRDPRRV
ncbi:HEAT repeat domain-containing protein [Tundrisphaera lichenicola]|uniref:HEAT repeat domain-containing protein n=1 Tax=Tundrisphaera lichenicola TaxID=2029860 RepID=UPI003EBE57D0